MNPVWRQELQHEIQKYEENVFSTFDKLKEKFECFVGPCQRPVVEFFHALMDHHFKSAYHRFVHELSLAQMTTQMPTPPSTVNENSISDEEFQSPEITPFLLNQSTVSAQTNPTILQHLDLTPNHIQIQKRKHSTEKPKPEKLVKKPKSTSPIRSTSALANMEPVNMAETVRKLKNTDKTIHSLCYGSFKCILCSVTSAKMVQHYVTMHAEHEVFISRLSPEMATLARQHRRTKLSANFCYFCGKIKENVIDWEQHILDHTGELPYQCSNCKKSLPSIAAHDSCSAEYVSDIFEINSPNLDRRAYLCNLCNFVQVDKERLVNHLRHEHEPVGNGTDTLNEIISITLKYNDIDVGRQQIDANHSINPDDKTDNAIEKEMPAIKHVDASILFSCGVVDCKFIAKNDRNFIQHLQAKHLENDSFNCGHCPNGTPFGAMNVKHAFSHTILHGDHLYKCNVCDQISPREFLINLHILRSHPNDPFKFRHTNRTTGSDVSNDVTIKFRCNMCTEQINMVADLSKHFAIVHKSIIIDCNAIRESSNANAINDTSLMFQQRWLCLSCNGMFSTKSYLIEHRKKNHPSIAFETQISRIIQIEAAKFPNYSNFKEQNERFDRYLMYYCAHCQNTEYGDVNSLYEHWKQAHIAADSLKPFRFEVATLAKCQSCKIISTFDGLKNHYEMQHCHLKVVINDLVAGGANVSHSGPKCGLCNYNGNNVIDHFADHDLIVQTNVRNPIPIDDSTIQLISTVQIIMKQIQCFHCKRIFISIADLEYHNVEEHPTKQMLYEDYTGNMVPFLIAGCCNIEIPMDGFVDHMRNHKTVPIPCQLCSFKARELNDLAKHDVTIHNVGQNQQFRLQCLIRTFYYQTRLVFGNGFVIAKANLIGTRYDDIDKLNEFFYDNGSTLKRRSIKI